MLISVNVSRQSVIFALSAVFAAAELRVTRGDDLFHEPRAIYSCRWMVYSCRHVCPCSCNLCKARKCRAARRALSVKNTSSEWKAQFPCACRTLKVDASDAVKFQMIHGEIDPRMIQSLCSPPVKKP